MINIHIYPSNLVYETRMRRTAATIVEGGFFDAVWLVGTHDPGLPRTELTTEGFCVKRIGARYRGSSFLVKVINSLIFYFSTIQLIFFKKIACVNAHSLTTLPLAFFIKSWKGCYLVYDTHELETETQSNSVLRRCALRLVERLFIRSADKVFCVSEQISDWYHNSYQIRRPETVLNSPSFGLVRRNRYLRTRFDVSDSSRVFVYVGLISEGRGVEEIIKVFELGKEFGGVVVFVGFGPLEGAIVHSRAFGSTIFLHPPVEEHLLAEIIGSADVGLCLIPPICLSYEFCMPNKLLQYVVAGVPVLVSPCESLIRFTLDNNIGVVAKSINPADIRIAIKHILSSNQEHLLQNVRTLSPALSWSSQSKIISESYKSLTLHDL